MRTLIATIFVFSTLAGYSQVTETTKVRRLEKGQIADSASAFRRVHLGFTISPDYVFRSLKPEPSDRWMARVRDKIDLPKFGFTVGLRFVYKFNQKFELENGFLFSEKGEKTKYLDLAGASGLRRIQYRYKYFDIPFKLNYKYLASEKTTYFFSAGVSANIFLRQRIDTTIDFDDGTSARSVSIDNSGVSPLNLALVVGFGLDYTLRKRLYIRIEPVFRQSLFPISNAAVNEYFYSFGLNVGLFFASGKLRSTKASFRSFKALTRSSDIQH